MARRWRRQGTPFFKCWTSLLLLLVLTGTAYAEAKAVADWCRLQTWRAFNRAVIIPADVADVPYALDINRYAQQANLDPRLVAAVVAAESSFNPRAVSSRHAYGLMQIIPSTWEYVNSQAKICTGRHTGPCREECYFTPVLNIRVGTWYLGQLYQRYHLDAVKAVAAYNAGPHNVDRYGGIPPFSETQRYVDVVVENWYTYAVCESPLFWRWRQGLLALRQALGWLLVLEGVALAAVAAVLYRRYRSWRWR